ncbi:MarR family transcriptional regulator [Clostridium sp. DJ247]|uniref:MarR family winged helix-turn-helix transcriptional regulator n=1 Tax=Clostridium sp. DJ247 TaxID=2726188 RepID=UPI001A9A8C0D
MKDPLSSLNNELVEKQAESIIRIFKNIQRALKVKLEKIAKQYGLTAPQLIVIFHLYEAPSITLHELSNHMMLSKSTVSGIIDRLAKQGIVNREIPKDNRRIVNLSISEEFKKNNDICNMKKKFISDLIYNSLKNEDTIDIEKIIYGLEQFSLLLKDKDCE